MRIYKIVEKKPEILGINFEEFQIWLVVTFLLFGLESVIAAIGINLGGWYYLFVLVIVSVLFNVLKMVSKKNYTGYIYSYISYKFLQPKKITSRYQLQNKKNGKSKHS